MKTPYQMKTDKEILDAFTLKSQGLPYSENVKFLKEVLSIKNAQIQKAQDNVEY